MAKVNNHIEIKVELKDLKKLNKLLGKITKQVTYIDRKLKMKAFKDFIKSMLVNIVKVK